MRYVVYGIDAVSQAALEPLTLDADSEEEARGRAVARGMAVRAVIAEQTPGPSAALSVEIRQAQGDGAAGESDEMRGARRVVATVLLPLALAFFLVVAVLRTLLQAVTWTVVWGTGVLLAGGLAGLLVWLARGNVPVAIAWPIGLALGLPIISAAHGARVGWRWWWAKRTLSPLAQVLGAAPQEELDDPESFRMPVILAQALAGGVLAAWFALAGIATDWGWPTLFAGMLGGALGLGCEGALLGAALARRQPMPLPEAASGPSIASLASLLSWLWGQKHIARSWILGYALDRAAPGAVAGTVIGVLVLVLSWLAVS
jgi:hypothetical protein